MYIPTLHSEFYAAVAFERAGRSANLHSMLDNKWHGKTVPEISIYEVTDLGEDLTLNNPELPGSVENQLAANIAPVEELHLDVLSVHHTVMALLYYRTLFYHEYTKIEAHPRGPR